MKRRLILSLLLLTSAGCVKETTVYPTYPGGSCNARTLEVYRYLTSAPPPTLPTIIRLTSGERVYIPDTAGHLPLHYDGPVCTD